MTEELALTQQAEGRIKIALTRLVEKYVFHVSVLEQFAIVSRPDVATMGVSVSGDHLVLYHNPVFVLNLPADELGGVLLHEVHHVVLGHVTADPGDFPDELARTTAEEVTVNEYVKEPLPEGAITLKMFPDLPPLESTRQRYRRLKKARNRMSISKQEATQRRQGLDGGKGGDQKSKSGTAPDGEDTNDNTAEGTSARDEARNTGSSGDTGKAGRGGLGDDGHNIRDGCVLVQPDLEEALRRVSE
jgi:Putative metallopeptidase domain